MTRIYFVFVTLIIAVLFLDVQGTPETQALSLPTPKSIFEDAIKKIMEISEKLMDTLRGAIDNAKKIMEKLKTTIRSEEDKLTNRLTTPFKQVTKKILDFIHNGEDIFGNSLQCVTGQTSNLLQVVKDGTRGMVKCANSQIKMTWMILADIQTIINEAEDLLREAPGKLMSCAHITLNPQEIIKAASCVIEDTKVFNSRMLLLLSSLTGDIMTLGKQGFDLPLQIVKCNLYYFFEETTQFGNAVQNMGICLKDVAQKQLR